MNNNRHFVIDLVLNFLNKKYKTNSFKNINGLKSKPGLITLFETACLAESSLFTDDAKI
jgi:hypothetical protein